jgi:dsDNA-binding SOS-regulon protein
MLEIMAKPDIITDLRDIFSKDKIFENESNEELLSIWIANDRAKKIFTFLD